MMIREIRPNCRCDETTWTRFTAGNIVQQALTPERRTHFSMLGLGAKPVARTPMLDWFKLNDAAQAVPVPQRVLVPNHDYVFVELASSFLESSLLEKDGSVPVILSETTIAGRVGEISIHKTITLDALEGPPRQRRIASVLAGPVPYRGGDVALSLVAAWLPRNQCTRALLELGSNMSAQAGGSVSESIRSFARLLAERNAMSEPPLFGSSSAAGWCFHHPRQVSTSSQTRLAPGMPPSALIAIFFWSEGAPSPRCHTPSFAFGPQTIGTTSR
jgi:hypothetical protein